MTQNIKNYLIENDKSYRNGVISKKSFIKKNYRIFHSKLFEYQEYLNKTGVRSIEISKNEIVFTMNEKNIKMVLPKKDIRSTPLEIFNFKKYEANETNIMKLLLKNRNIFIDVGANFGWYSLFISKYFSKSEVHSFEPISNTFKYFKRNIEINNCKNIIPNNIGLSDKSKKILFFYSQSHSGVASSKNLENLPNIKKYNLNVKTLDEYCHKNKLKPDFIKCDVEGAEFLVFKGAKKTLKTCKPIVFSEILRKWSKKFNYNPNDIFKLFNDIGYTAFTASNFKLKKFYTMQDITKQTNFFFLHNKKHKKLIETYI